MVSTTDVLLEWLLFCWLQNTNDPDVNTGTALSFQTFETHEHLSYLLYELQLAPWLR